jgi:hypothetical protein
MNEILNKLIESEVLTEETKKELTESIQLTINEAVRAATKETEDKVRAELTAQYLADFEKLVEAVDVKTEEHLKTELTELKEDIQNFRDVETEYAERLVEARAEMANQIKADMETLVDNLDAFLTERLEEEFKELREDIDETKKLAFGKKIFESYAAEFKNAFLNEDETYNSLKETQTELENTRKALTESKKLLESVKRDQKMAKLLESLQGRPKEIMEALLKNAPTEKLEESYNKYIGRVIHESIDATAQKETVVQKDTAVLAESVKNGESKVVSGNTEDVFGLLDSTQKILSENETARLRKLVSY